MGFEEKPGKVSYAVRTRPGEKFSQGETWINPGEKEELEASTGSFEKSMREDYRKGTKGKGKGM